MTHIRNFTETDSQKFINMLMQLDNETRYMMYEPGERKITTSQLNSKFMQPSNKLLTLLIDDLDNSCIGGFLSAERGGHRKIQHSAYVVIGMLKQYRHKGFGTKMFKMLDEWALSNEITRLELTVAAENINAVNLYTKMGFIKEGIKKNSLIIDGKYMDEFYMSKILL